MCFGTLAARQQRKVKLASLEAMPGRGVQKRDTAVEGRTLKGSKAQESIGLGVVETRRSATDSDLEQSLEVEAWVASGKRRWKHWSGKRVTSWTSGSQTTSVGWQKERRHRADSEEATTAVTQYGCGRGEDSGGYE